MSEKKMDHHQDIREAQAYLTRIKDGEKELIVGIDYLSQNHSRQEIIRFLKDYLHEKEKALRELTRNDRSSNQIDETVSVMFRIHMAISVIEKRMEVNNIVRLKHRAGKSGPVCKWNRSRHRSARLRKNSHNDGKNRQTGYRARSAA